MRFERLTEKAREAIIEAQNEAREYKHASIDPEHLLLALLRQQGGVVPAVIDRMGGDKESLRTGLEQLLAAKSRVSGGTVETRMGREMAQLLEEAETIAANMKDEYTSTEHLLMAMASARNGDLRQLLERHGIDYNGIMQGLAAVRGSQRVTSQTPEAQYEALVKYGRDLTAEAAKGNLDPIIGRDQEIRRVVQILSRRTKNNPVLIGEPGVGKTAIAEGLAQRIINGDVPTTLKTVVAVGPWLWGGPSTAAVRYGQGVPRNRDAEAMSCCSSTKCTPRAPAQRTNGRPNIQTHAARASSCIAPNLIYRKYTRKSRPRTTLPAASWANRRWRIPSRSCAIEARYEVHHGCRHR